MNVLLRFLGLGGETNDPGATPSVRAIADRLESLPAERARYVAAFALVLARVANADLRIDDEERAEMQRIVGEDPALGEADARLVVEIVQAQADEIAGAEDYLVTREFRRISDRAGRLHLLRCLHAVAAADGSILASESQEIAAIGEELGFSRAETSALRAEWSDYLSELQSLRRPAER